jgi:beta-lactam-binding protein with PASTA domain
VAALLVVILVTSIVALVRYIQVDETLLPDLRGMQYAEAAELLRDRGLAPTSYPDNVPNAPFESVTAQTPLPGAIVRRGRRIAIGVNRPPEAGRAPVLVGLTVEQALNTAKAVSQTVAEVSYAHGAQAAGRVIAQRPEPGERVEPDNGLKLVVSRGPPPTVLEMPDLGGLPVDQARERLLKLGIRSVESVATGVSFDSAGRVTSQEPSAGRRVTVGTPVILGYNLSARDVVPVPRLAGEPAVLAERMLRAAGLSVGEVRYVDDDEVPRGGVVEASLTGYTLRGTTVSLTLNAAAGTYDDLRRRGDSFRDDFFLDSLGEGRSDLLGDREASDYRGDDAAMDGGGVDRIDGAGGDDAALDGGGRRVTVTFDPATLGVRSLLERSYDLRLVVKDETGERTVLDRRVRAGEKVSVVVIVRGDALLQTFINGVFFQAWRP